ncbi:MAG: DsbE family thiol:disulfide interchange protein [Alphaproteobacteria bacterium]|nr:DsbE family thiol:disulfide interchange protein [Alphaproteobacteria bacterium]
MTAQPISLPRRRWLFLLPVAVFALLAAAFAVGLGRDPTLVPSVLIDQPAPTFDLPPVIGRDLGLKTADLAVEVSLVNVFASWCVACRVEHPLLLRLSREGIVPIHGLNYKDVPEDADAWLDELGDPYTRTGVDRDGRVGIDWGVYGVPETFVIDRDGRIRYKHVGPITPEAWETTIWPLIQDLRS